MHERSQLSNEKTFTFKTQIVFIPLLLFFFSYIVCTCGCDVDRGRGALPEKSPDNHGYLRGAAGGGHRVCGCLL